MNTNNLSCNNCSCCYHSLSRKDKANWFSSCFLKFFSCRLSWTQLLWKTAPRTRGTSWHGWQGKLYTVADVVETTEKNRVDPGAWWKPSGACQPDQVTTRRGRRWSDQLYPWPACRTWLAITNQAGEPQVSLFLARGYYLQFEQNKLWFCERKKKQSWFGQIRCFHPNETLAQSDLLAGTLQSLNSIALNFVQSLIFSKLLPHQCQD